MCLIVTFCTGWTSNLWTILLRVFNSWPVNTIRFLNIWNQILFILNDSKNLIKSVYTCLNRGNSYPKRPKLPERGPYQNSNSKEVEPKLCVLAWTEAPTTRTWSLLQISYVAWLMIMYSIIIAWTSLRNCGVNNWSMFAPKVSNEA